MIKRLFSLVIITFSSLALSGCLATKIVTAPIKVATTTTKVAAKTVVTTGKVAGKVVGGTSKGVYYAGKVPVQISDKALDSATKVLLVTTQVVDTAGKVMTLTKEIKASKLDAELQAIKHSTNIVRVFIDAAG